MQNPNALQLPVEFANCNELYDLYRIAPHLFQPNCDAMVSVLIDAQNGVYWPNAAERAFGACVPSNVKWTFELLLTRLRAAKVRQATEYVWSECPSVQVALEQHHNDCSRLCSLPHDMFRALLRNQYLIDQCYLCKQATRTVKPFFSEVDRGGRTRSLCADCAFNLLNTQCRVCKKLVFPIASVGSLYRIGYTIQMSDTHRVFYCTDHPIDLKCFVCNRELYHKNEMDWLRELTDGPETYHTYCTQCAGVILNSVHFG